MALTKCKDCSNEMSTDAAACPRCGAPAPKKTSAFTWVVAVITIVVVYQCTSSAVDRVPGPGKSASQIAADAATEKRFQAVVAGARWIKKSMKNPASFELVSAMLIGEDIACYTYRGTNSFNAIITSNRVISNTVNSGEPAAWNKHCAGKSGEDFTYARRAL